ncbi:MAG: hypothetical protein Q9M19_07490 [Mariprofundaceae bacterium]|nr:hypothetical protein [Mariprofundaceae bacterium]
MNWVVEQTLLSKLFAYLCMCGLLFLPHISQATGSGSTAWYATHQFQAADIKKLEAGRVVLQNQTLEGAPAEHVQAFIIVDAPVTHVFALIKDFPQLVAYAPYVENIEVLRQSEQQAVVNYALALPFGVTSRYRLQLSFEQHGLSRTMVWKSVPWAGLKAEETIVSSTGYWWLEPGQDDGQTLLTYQTITDPGHVPFGLGWIVDILSRSGVVDLLKSTKQRAEQSWEQR